MAKLYPKFVVEIITGHCNLRVMTFKWGVDDTDCRLPNDKEET